jgi:hypothetical protein
MKDKDIVDINFDGDYLIIDLRFKIPQHLCSGQLLKDIINMKIDIINGSFIQDTEDDIHYLKYQARVVEDENGNESVVFNKKSIKLQ